MLILFSYKSMTLSDSNNSYSSKIRPQTNRTRQLLAQALQNLAQVLFFKLASNTEMCFFIFVLFLNFPCPPTSSVEQPFRLCITAIVYWQWRKASLSWKACFPLNVNILSQSEQHCYCTTWVLASLFVVLSWALQTEIFNGICTNYLFSKLLLMLYDKLE